MSTELTEVNVLGHACLKASAYVERKVVFMNFFSQDGDDNAYLSFPKCFAKSCTQLLMQKVLGWFAVLCENISLVC